MGVVDEVDLLIMSDRVTKREWNTGGHTGRDNIIYLTAINEPDYGPREHLIADFGLDQDGYRGNSDGQPSALSPTGPARAAGRRPGREETCLVRNARDFTMRIGPSKGRRNGESWHERMRSHGVKRETTDH